MSDVYRPYKNKQHATPHAHFILLPGSAYFPEVNKKKKAENQPSGQDPSSAGVRNVLTICHNMLLHDSSSQMSPRNNHFEPICTLSQNPHHNPQDQDSGEAGEAPREQILRRCLLSGTDLYSCLCKSGHLRVGASLNVASWALCLTLVLTSLL